MCLPKESLYTLLNSANTECVCVRKYTHGMKSFQKLHANYQGVNAIANNEKSLWILLNASDLIVTCTLTYPINNYKVPVTNDSCFLCNMIFHKLLIHSAVPLHVTFAIDRYVCTLLNS